MLTTLNAGDTLKNWWAAHCPKKREARHRKVPGLLLFKAVTSDLLAVAERLFISALPALKQWTPPVVAGKESWCCDPQRIPSSDVSINRPNPSGFSAALTHSAEPCEGASRLDDTRSPDNFLATPLEHIPQYGVPSCAPGVSQGVGVRVITSRICWSFVLCNATRNRQVQEGGNLGGKTATPFLPASALRQLQSAKPCPSGLFIRPPAETAYANLLRRGA